MVKSIQELQAANMEKLNSLAGGDEAAAPVQDRTTDTSIDHISNLVRGIGLSMDTDKATVAVALLNTFNLAVGKLGGRAAWNVRDFMAYGMALSAINQIEQTTTADFTGGQDRADGTAAVTKALQ